MISVTVVKNDLPKLMRANNKIANHMDTLLTKIGSMMLDSAQEAMDSGGPGWIKHSRETTNRWGVHALLHTPTSKTYETKDGTPLSDIRSNYHYDVSNVFAGRATLEIIGLTTHAMDMYAIHNRAKGRLLSVGNGARIPGRPYFVWKTGHTQKSEDRKARKITTDFIRDNLKSYGINTRGYIFELGI